MLNHSEEDSGFTSDGGGHPSSGNSGESIPGSTNHIKTFRAQGHLAKNQASIDSDIGHETDFCMSK